MNHAPSDQGAVIVTGASRGIGAAAARQLAAWGAPVVLGGRTESDLESLVRALEDRGGRAIAVAGDLRSPAVRGRLVQTAVEAFGAVRSLVNNAGLLGPLARVAEAQAERWQEVWEVNVLAPVLLTAEALPWLRRSGGRVINVSSGAAERAIAGWGAYSLSKAALNQFTRLLAAEEPQVTVVALRPGMVDTLMQAEIRRHGQSAMSPEAHANFMRAFEQNQLLSPERAGDALARLGLFAPPSLSGELISWDDPRLQSLSPS